jgi:signal transduction histidine kinase
MVIQNILSNSVKYTPEGGKIKLSIVLANTENILLKISDTGYGIPKKQHSQIFTKLFRADNVRDKDTDGTGLGLYIVKSIVEKSGGKIWFESPEENRGTTFYVTLPIKGMPKKRLNSSSNI